MTPPSPVRVARVIARLNIGGPAQHVIHLTAGLARDRFESVLLSGREGPFEGNMRDLAARAGVQPIAVPGLGRRLSPIDDLRSLVFLTRFFRRFRPHIVHTHSTNRLLAVSESVQRELERYGVGRPGQITVLPLGLDLGRFLRSEARRGEFRRELGLDDGRPLIGIVARLVPIKRHEDFIAASALVLARHPEARFLVIGDGERRTELEALTGRCGLSERVRFLGWRHDLDRIYVDLDVVVLTSANEGSPVSLIEAMAAARPVVATAVGGVPDLVEHGVTGWLTPSGDPSSLADAIATLLADPERRRAMGTAGRKRVADGYGVDRLVSDVERLYTDLMSRRRP